ncbi:MAG TPA: methyltransferase domain-containing protein, partial [bacterium]|nr:methyltransferase domain-containing protein [bacterium]
MAKYVFPSWKGWLLINPVRLLLQPPDRVLGDLVAPGMTVLDLGCSMGYFTLPLARQVGPHGRVLCLDCDDAQLRVLRRRAARAGLLDRLDLRLLAPTVPELALAR